MSDDTTTTPAVTTPESASADCLYHFYGDVLCRLLAESLSKELNVSYSDVLRRMLFIGALDMNARRSPTDDDE